MSNEEEDAPLVEVYTIGGIEYPNKLQEHLSLRTQNVNDSFCDHGELFAWYATAHEVALDLEVRAKEELARIYARLDHQTRTAAKGAGVKMTEKMTENTVITDPQYIAEQSKYHDAKRNTGLLKAAKDAMIHRRDMLVQLGATYRAEGNSDMNLLTDQYNKTRGN